MRALETGRPMRQIIANGISAIISSDSYLVEQTKQFEPAMLNSTLYAMMRRIPYVTFGNLMVLIIIPVVLVAISRKSILHSAMGMK